MASLFKFSSQTAPEESAPQNATPPSTSNTTLKIPEPVKQEMGTQVRMMTVGEMFDVAITKFKDYVANLNYVTQELNTKIQSLTKDEVTDWVIWITKEKKSLRAGVVDIFNMYGMKVSLLTPEQFQKFINFFEIFQESVNFKFK